MSEERGRTMDIRVLKYFVTVAEEGSITKAAKKLNMSQPPLSKQMRQLEEETGVILFIRGKKNIQLTEAGSFLKSRADTLLSSFDSLERQVREYRDGKKGKITIGAVEAVATNYLPKVIHTFRKKYGDITYEILSGSTDDILGMLDKGMIDVGFIRNASDGEKYNSFELRRDSWGVLIPEEHRLAAPEVERITPELLNGEPLIIPSTHARVEELQTWFHDMQIEPEILCHYNTLAIGEALAREKLGVVFVLVDYENAELHQHMICKKIEPALGSSVNVLWSKSQYLSEPASRFIEFMRKEL